MNDETFRLLTDLTSSFPSDPLCGAVSNHDAWTAGYRLVFPRDRPHEKLDKYPFFVRATNAFLVKVKLLKKQ
jgi:hypothetical protein